MKKISKTVISLLLAAAMLLCLAACGKDEDDDWLADEGGNNVSVDGELSVSSLEEDAESLGDGMTAPKFKTGSYTMTSTDVQKFDYDDGSGNTLMMYYLTTEYIYDMDVKVSDNGITAKYTFKKIYGDYSEGAGEKTVQLDTDDTSLQNEANKMYYDLVGHSFTAYANAKGELVNVSGYNEIIAALPEVQSNGLLSAELLNSIAAQTFYTVPEKLEFGTKWNYNFNGYNNNCSVARYTRGKIGVNIRSDEPTVPEVSSTGDGYFIEYEKISPLVGTLWFDESDRALQEYSAYTSSRAHVYDASGNGYYLQQDCVNRLKIAVK